MSNRTSVIGVGTNKFEKPGARDPDPHIGLGGAAVMSALKPAAA